MRKSRAITLTLLSGLMLTACLVSNFGCGGRRAVPPPDHSWYDASGHRIEQKWKLDEHGNRAVDEQGRPIPDPHVPYDNYGRPWVYTGGVWAPLPPPVSYTRSSSSTWLWGGSGYRTTTSGSSYRPSPSIGSSSSSSSPSRSVSPSSSSSPSSISRGGFGSTGAGSSSS